MSRLVALLAVLGQLLVGAAIPAHAMLTADAAPDGIVICHGAGPDDTNAPAHAPAHHDDCALCPACHALAAAAALPSPPSPPQPPAFAAVALPIQVPPARAPPASPVLAAIYPTGPPPLA